MIVTTLLLCYTFNAASIDFSNLKKDTATVDYLVAESQKIHSKDTVIMFAEYGLKLASELSYELGEANALHSLAIINYLYADYSKAIYFVGKELDIYEKNNSFGNISKKGEAYRMLGEISRADKEYVKAQDYLKIAESLFNKNRDMFGLSKTFNRYAATIQEMTAYSDDPRIIEYLDKADKIAKENNFREVIANNLNLYATHYSKHGSLSEAIETFKSTLEYFENDGSYSEKSNVLRNIANTYRKMGNIDSALVYGRLSYEEAIKQNVHAHMFNSSWALYTLFYENIKNNDSAVYYLHMAITYQKFVYDAENLMSKLHVQYKFESDLKDKQIEAQEEINLYQFLIFAGIIIILIFALIFYYYKVRIEQNANKIITLQKEELTNTNASKDKLFSIIAHDLKNPIGAFKSLAGIMNDDYNSFTDSEKIDYVKMMKESADSLYNLLENLLTWSRNQRGSIPNNPENINLNLIVDKTVDLLSLQANEKKIVIIKEIQENVTIFTDVNQFNIILRNLISNSIKFSNPNSEIILIANDTKVDNFDYVHLKIMDFGVGMDERKVNTLFSVAENQSTRGTNGEKGTGLGMLLINDFVINNNGKIMIESELGKGTTVHLYFPKLDISKQ